MGAFKTYQYETSSEKPSEKIPSDKKTPTSTSKLSPAISTHHYSKAVEDVQKLILKIKNVISTDFSFLFLDDGKKFNFDPKLINRLSSISKKTKEGSVTPDGLWGQKTQDALNSIYEFVYNFIDVLKSNNISTSKYFYDDKDLSDFSKYAYPGKKFTDIKPDDIEKTANLLFSSLFEIYNFLEKSSEDAKNISLKPKDQIILTQQKQESKEQDLLKDISKEDLEKELPELKTPSGDKTYTISLNDLSSQDKFVSYLNRIGVKNPTQKQINELIDNLLSQTKTHLPGY